MITVQMHWCGTWRQEQELLEGSREAEVKVGTDFSFWESAVGDTLPSAMLCHSSFPHTTNWGPSVQTAESTGDILIQTTAPSE